MKILEITKLREKVDYNNWDHQESADYSKYLEKHLVHQTNLQTNKLYGMVLTDLKELCVEMNTSYMAHLHHIMILFIPILI